MAKVVVTEYVTLDGVMEDPGGGEGGQYGGWSFQFWSDEAAKFKFDELFASDALLLGRVTYEGFARAWPSVKDEAGFADRMNWPAQVRRLGNPHRRDMEQYANHRGRHSAAGRPAEAAVHGRPARGGQRHARPHADAPRSRG